MAAGTEKLAKYSLLAGERALAAYAWEEARSHFQRGLAARGIPLGSDQSAPDVEAAALLFGLGRAQLPIIDRGELPQAIASMRRAFDYYADVGDVDHALAVAQSRYPSRSGQSTGAAELIARAFLLVAADSHQAGSLLSRHGYVLGMEEGNQEAAKEALDRALAIARREQDPALELRTLAEAARVDRFDLHSQESLSKSRRAIELLRRFDDPEAEVAAHYEASLAVFDIGDTEEAQQHATAMLGAAERLRDQWGLCSALGLNGGLSQAKGDWQAGRDFGERGLAVSPRDSRILARLALLEHQVGNAARGGGTPGKPGGGNERYFPGTHRAIHPAGCDNSCRRPDYRRLSALPHCPGGRRHCSFDAILYANGGELGQNRLGAYGDPAGRCRGG